MYEQFNAQFAPFAKQAADSALKANTLALEHAERLFALQLRTLEDRAGAAFGFFGEAVEVRDLDGAKALLPKGLQLARENAEKLYSVGQEAIGQTIKTQEAIAQLIKAQFEAAGEEVAKTATKASKATKQ